MTQTFGIDLGTTNSVISRLVDGKPVPIPIHGSSIVPSVVLFDGDRVAVGREARNLELVHPERTVRSVKRKMGSDFLYSMGTRQLTPEQVSAEILGALKAGAELETGEAVRDVVITVPAYFDDAQRRATLKAGELAGLNVLRLLNEPTSASLVYDRVGEEKTTSDPELVLVYDLGGGTFDASLLEVFQGVREVRSTLGNTQLGGDDFDELLVRLFVDKLKHDQGVDVREDPRAMARLRRVAEDTKIRLSSETRVQVSEEFLAEKDGKPVHLTLEVNRHQLEDLLRPLIESTVQLSRQAVGEAKLSGQQLSRVCLVGGSTRIPLVRRMLVEEFGVPVHDEVDVDLAVGLGASVQAALLAGQSVGRILVDVASHSLGMKVLGPEDEFRAEVDTFAPLIRRNTVLPATRAEEFATLTHEQEKIIVEVFQGEADRASENARVGSFDYPLQPVPAGSPVRVEFSYDLSGVVRVSISQPGLSNQKTVSLSVAGSSNALPVGGESGAVASSSVERKARALLQTLTGRPREQLEALLQSLSSSAGTARSDAEDALLDFFLEHEGS